MKKLIYLLLAVLFLAGCSNQPVKEEAEYEIKVEPIEYNLASLDINEGLAVVSDMTEGDGKRYGFLKPTGELLGDGLAYELRPKPFYNGMTYVVKNRPFGYFINTEGEKIIEQVDGMSIVGADFFHLGRVNVSLIKDSETAITDLSNAERIETAINEKGEIVEPNTFMTDDGLFIGLTNGQDIGFYYDFDVLGAKKTYGIYDKATNTKKTDFAYSSACAFVNGKSVVTDLEGKVMLIDSDGKELLNISKIFKEAPVQYSLTDSTIALNFGEFKPVIIDFEGNIVKKTDYGTILSFYKNYANVTSVKDKLYLQPTDSQTAIMPTEQVLVGLIDSNGVEILPIEYEEISTVWDNLVYAKKDGKWNRITIIKSE